MFDADIQQLWALATTLDGVAAEIDKIDVRATGDQIASALPGCSLGQVCAQAGEFTEGAWLRVAQRIQKLSTIVKESTNSYTITDEEFKTRLDAMDFTARDDH